MSIKFDRTFGLLEASLDGSIARQKAIAHNVSNIDTPGFKRYLVDIEQQLKNSRETRHLPLQTTRSNHINGAVDEAFSGKRDLSPGLRPDGNNVNLESEMINLVKNDVYFSSALHQMNKKFSMLRLAIDGK